MNNVTILRNKNRNFHLTKNNVSGSISIISINESDFNDIYKKTFLGYNLKEIKNKIKLDMNLTGNFKEIK